MDPGRHETSPPGASQAGSLPPARAEPVKPGTAWSVLADATPPVAVWSSPDGEIIVSEGVERVIRASGQSRIATVRERLAALWKDLTFSGPSVARPRVIGGMRFTPGGSSDAGWQPFPDAMFVLPQRQVLERDGGAWLTAFGTAPDPAGGAPPSTVTLPNRLTATARPGREEWIARVDEALGDIAAGRYEKVVLAHAMDLELSERMSLIDVVHTLRAENPDCFVVAMQPNRDAVFLAATPERLVQRSGDTVTTDALAGSNDRGDTTAADERRSSALIESEKDRQEHHLVVKSIRDDLEQFGGDVRIGERGVARLRSVHHLHTPIVATYDDVPHVLELVSALHPTPAVGGLPRQAALEAIERLEAVDRGWYAAPLGWVDPAGNGTFAVGIRSARVSGEEARLFAGAGIVAESDPAAEWEELTWKYRPILETFPNR